MKNKLQTNIDFNTCRGNSFKTQINIITDFNTGGRPSEFELQHKFLIDSIVELLHKNNCDLRGIKIDGD